MLEARELYDELFHRMMVHGTWETAAGAEDQMNMEASSTSLPSFILNTDKSLNLPSHLQGVCSLHLTRSSFASSRVQKIPHKLSKVPVPCAEVVTLPKAFGDDIYITDYIDVGWTISSECSFHRPLISLWHKDIESSDSRDSTKVSCSK